MAQEGFLSVVVGHPESSLRSVRRQASGEGLRAGLAELVTDPAAYAARFQDIDAAKAWARARCAQGPAVLAGHSMGAATVMLTAGARNRLGVAGVDDFDLYVALSPQGPGTIFPEHAWSGIQKPVLSITGTQDTELGGAPWQHRLEPWKSMSAPCKWAAVLDGASHMNLGGRDPSDRTQRQVARVVGSFLSTAGVAPAARRAESASACAVPAQLSAEFERDGISLTAK